METRSDAPPSPAIALPDNVARIWLRFSEREIAKGRRDISALIEVTLQFVLEQENRSLLPMVSALERLRQWEAALAKEATGLHQCVVKGSGDEVAEPYQKVNILLDRQPSSQVPINRVPLDAPTRSRPELIAFLEQMQKQQALVTQAAAEHMQALQGRRQEQAERLRQYASTMHAMAKEMVARQPPPPPKAPRKFELAAAAAATAASATGAGAQSMPSRAKFKLPTRQTLASVPWQKMNPLHFARACYAALVQGYRDDPPPDDIS